MHDAILIQVSGVHPELPETFARVRSVETGCTVTTLGVPAEDFMEFAAHIAGAPPWQPSKDPYDRETMELMVKHVETCSECHLEQRCSKYFELILERVKVKERRHKN
jgi:hypothetical protein